jgi:lysophospholipase L1-like esterase
LRRAAALRRYLPLVLLALGSIGGFAVVAEVLCRISERRSAPPREVAFRKSTTPGLAYEFVPGARLPWAGREIQVNARGFRGPEFTAQPGRRPRVAILGDSIAAGYGVAEEDALPARVSRALVERAADVEVLGLGVPGYNIAHILALWNARARDFGASVVVYAVCLNDALPELTLSADGRLEASASVELAPTRAMPGRIPFRGKRWLYAHSAFYRFLVTRYDRALQRLGLRTPPLPPEERLDLLYASSPLGATFQARLRELAESVRASGATLIVACFPTADEVRSGRAGPQASLAATSRQLGVEFIDLLPAFREAHPAGGLFLEDGLHPSAAGHAVAAIRVAEGIRSALQDRDAHRVRPASAASLPER